jgi:hypothetical protein
MGQANRNFRLLEFHGTLCPQDPCGEDQINRQTYACGELQLRLPNGRMINVRLIGYETPLFFQEGDHWNWNPADLLGYDQDWHPWIIELKRANTNDTLEEAKHQIVRYGTLFRPLANEMQTEVRNKLHWGEFCFSGDPCLMVLAPQGYFDQPQRQAELQNGIQSLDPGEILPIKEVWCCAFAGLQAGDEFRLAVIPARPIPLNLKGRFAIV